MNILYSSSSQLFWPEISCLSPPLYVGGVILKNLSSAKLHCCKGKKYMMVSVLSVMDIYIYYFRPVGSMIVGNGGTQQ